MSTRLLFRPEARLDIEDAALWYEDQRSDLGRHLADEITSLLDRIRKTPLQFPVVGEGVRKGLLHRFPYAVYFLLEDDAVTVLAVLHQRRDPQFWKRRL
jgi:plasmid stabilization system protein ParE